MNEVYLLLGTNLGEKRENLHLASRKIELQIGSILLKSGIYETEPWGISDQAAYLNQVIKTSTVFSPNELLNNLKTIEKEMGRERRTDNRWRERIIDIDILFYNKLVHISDDLSIPHPRMHLRKFTLYPLVEIAGDLLHPVLNKTIKSLLEEVKDDLKVALI